jgi:hypothetical protein
MATYGPSYGIARTTEVRRAARIALVVLLLFVTLAVGFGLGRTTSTPAKATPVTTLRPGDVTEPAWRVQLHAAMNRLAADHARA